jgi:hypothetical protein
MSEDKIMWSDDELAVLTSALGEDGLAIFLSTNGIAAIEDEEERSTAKEAALYNARQAILMRVQSMSVTARELLAATDYVVVKSVEGRIDLPQDWLKWREDLRDVIRGTRTRLPEEPDGVRR